MLRTTKFVFALALTEVSACAHAGTSAFIAASPGAEYVRTELYFGTLHGGRPVVSEDAWAAFLAEVVTPRFPDGLTILAGRGQWLEHGTLVREESRVLIIFHPPTVT